MRDIGVTLHWEADMSVSATERLLHIVSYCSYCVKNAKDICSYLVSYAYIFTYTQECERLGWRGPGGMFDVLPVVLQARGHDPEWFVLPDDLILQVTLCHPE